MGIGEAGWRPRGGKRGPADGDDRAPVGTRAGGRDAVPAHGGGLGRPVMHGADLAYYTWCTVATASNTALTRRRPEVAPERAAALG